MIKKIRGIGNTKALTVTKDMTLGMEIKIGDEIHLTPKMKKDYLEWVIRIPLVKKEKL